MNDFDGSLFPCPACSGNCYPDSDNNLKFINLMKCSKCNEEWSPLYIRGFMAGYAKREKEIKNG